MRSKLILVGAGPGDPELITIKGAKALGSADVVLYDALTDIRMLDYATKAKKKVFVGKRGGDSLSVPQEEIHSLILNYSRKYNTIVRLKGGDPFVFGRGMEEVLFARANDIEVEVIPGLSSATALPALAGIPLTHRLLSSSFWVLTGTEKAGELSKLIPIALSQQTTLVILMGLHRIEQIMHTAVLLGYPNLPVAVISQGSTEQEQIISGTSTDIAYKVKEGQISSPAIIIAGEVVSFLKKNDIALTKVEETRMSDIQ